MRACGDVRVGEAAELRNECEVLVRIRKGYGWQLEEHPKIAGQAAAGIKAPSEAGAAAGRRLGPAALWGAAAVGPSSALQPCSVAG